MSTTVLIKPNGRFVEVDANDADTLIKRGYQQATPEQLSAEDKRQEMDEKYGGYLGSAAAFGAGLVREPSFAASDWLLTKSGLVDPETLQYLKDYHPIASGAGGLVGLGASLLIPGGGEVKLAEKGAAKAASKVAGLAAKGAEAEVIGKEVQSAVKASQYANELRSAVDAQGAVAKGIRTVGAPAKYSSYLGRTVEEGLGGGLLGKTLGGAAEGTLYGLGTVNSEAALGDPNLTWESAATTIGMSGLLGGGFGTAFGLAGKGLGKVSEKIAKAREAWAKAAPGLEERGVRAIGRATDLGEETAEKTLGLLRKHGDILENPAARNVINQERFDGVKNLDVGIDDAMEATYGKETFDKIRGTPQAQDAANQGRFEALQALDQARDTVRKELYGPNGLKEKAIRAALENAPVGKMTPEEAVNEIAHSILSEINRMKGNPGYDQGIVKELEDWYGEFLARAGKRKAGQVHYTEGTPQADLGKALPKSFQTSDYGGVSKKAEGGLEGMGGLGGNTLTEGDNLYLGAARETGKVETSSPGRAYRTSGYMEPKPQPKTAADHFLDVDYFKRSLDDRMGDAYSLDPEKQKLADRVFKNVTGTLRQLLEDESVFGDAARIQKRMNAVVSEDIGARKASMSEFGNTRLNKMNEYVPGEGYDPNKFKSFYSKTEKRIEDKQAILDRIVKSSQDVDAMAKELGGKGTGDLSKHYAALAPEPDDEVIRTYRKFQDDRRIAKDRFGTQKQEKAHGYEVGSAWDQRRFNTLSSKQAHTQGFEDQAILDNYISSGGDVISALERHPHPPAGPNVTLEELASLQQKAAKAAKTAQEVEELQAILKPTRMSGATNIAPAPEKQFSSWGYSAGIAAAAYVHPALALVAGAGKAAADYAKNYPMSIRLMAKLGSYGDKVLKSVDSAAKSLVKGNAVTGQALRGPLASQIASYTVDEQVKTYERRVKLVQQHSQNPIDSMASVADGLDEYAPDTAGAVRIGTAKKLAYLEQAIPATPQRGALGGKRQVSLAEVQSWNRKFHAVSRPLEVLQRASLGQATGEEIAAVRATSPALFEVYRQSLARHIAELGDKKMSATQIKIMNKILGVDLDGSKQLGLAIAALPKEDRDSPDVAKPRGMNFQSKGSDRLLTPAQRAAQRSV